MRKYSVTSDELCTVPCMLYCSRFAQLCVRSDTVSKTLSLVLMRMTFTNSKAIWGSRKIKFHHLAMTRDRGSQSRKLLMLNSSTGVTIYIGVSDDSVVHGMLLRRYKMGSSCMAWLTNTFLYYQLTVTASTSCLLSAEQTQKHTRGSSVWSKYPSLRVNE